MSADLGLNAGRGRRSYATVTSGLRVSHVNRRQFELESSSTVTYVEAEGDVVARRLVTSLKGDWRPQATFSPFFFLSMEQDRIRRLALLSSGGAGMKWIAVRNAAGAVSLSAATLFTIKALSQSDITAREAGTRDPQRLTLRASIRPKVVQQFPSGLAIEVTPFWQPVIGRAGDYMIDMSSRVGYQLGARQSMFVQYTYRKDSRPPSGVVGEDQLLVFGIKLSR